MLKLFCPRYITPWTAKNGGIIASSHWCFDNWADAVRYLAKMPKKRGKVPAILIGSLKSNRDLRPNRNWKLTSEHWTTDPVRRFQEARRDRGQPALISKKREEFLMGKLTPLLQPRHDIRAERISLFDDQDFVNLETEKDLDAYAIRGADMRGAYEEDSRWTAVQFGKEHVNVGFETAFVSFVPREVGQYRIFMDDDADKVRVFDPNGRIVPCVRKKKKSSAFASLLQQLLSRPGASGP